ncbi:MAG: hypothetical protein LQ337_004815 [Flavoplaca oasis]|nr:MAG: hypothetical protein LQ337_004815 [Flavoplaca oasis]
MGKKRKYLSHEEIWDDSALVNSWDLALQDIHARGEKVEDVIRKAEDPEEVPKDKRQDNGIMNSDNLNGMPHTQEPGDEEVEDGEIEDDLLVNKGTMQESAHTKEETSTVQEYHAPPPARDDGPGSVPEPSNVPNVLMNGDQGLKNLMMSWYYAGYYTGLYEGRKQPDAVASSSTGNPEAKP